MISELVSGNSLGLEGLLKENVWDVEIALNESRTECSSMRLKIATMERAIKSLEEERE